MNKKDTEQPSERAESGRRGGLARAQSLPPDHRSSIAKKAAMTRWEERDGKATILRATHKGSFQEHFGFDVVCYVLDDESKTAVISQRGMATALGLRNSGSALPSFLEGQIISKAVGAETLQKAMNPLIFQGLSVGANSEPTNVVHGYDVTLLIDICKGVVKAESEGKLLSSQSNVAKQAHIILAASAKAGIKGLVYALSGYDATKEEIIASFKRYVLEEAREYESEFPSQLYMEWYRLYEIPKPERNKPWKFKHLTVDQVYHPLARSNGTILELTRIAKTKGTNRSKKLHQFLSEIGVKALRRHLGQLLGIAQVSDNQLDYERKFEKVFGQQLPLL